MNTVTVTTPSDLEVVISRAFQAPRAPVWDAMTVPELMRRWCNGPDGWATSACENDLRVGGSFRHAWRHRDGHEMVMTGVYRELVPLRRLVRTEVFEMGCESRSEATGGTVATLELADVGAGAGAGTALTVTLRFATKEARDGMLASGMSGGMEVVYAQLDRLLREG